MNNYTEELRKIKSLLIVTSLQKKADIKAWEFLKSYAPELEWNLDQLGIESQVWDYITKKQSYAPQHVFCHPDLLMAYRPASLYFRGLAGLSIKSVEQHVGGIKNLEIDKSKGKLLADKAMRMTRLYNTFICSNIKGAVDWTLEDGHRTILATMGITYDGIMRNTVGTIAEDRVRALLLQYVVENHLVVSPPDIDPMADEPLAIVELNNGIFMKFASDPDVSFFREDGRTIELLAIVEIKGGIDPAGALERYGAATKSFQHALATSSKCKNFFLSAVYTTELTRRIEGDRLVEKYFDIIQIIEEPTVRELLYRELFHFTLRII